ncbi:MAG: zinc-ribbon domain-containing protein [Bacteroidota bacterium]
MIIYGRSGAKNIQSQSFPGSTCPHCQSNSIEGHVYSTYAHVFWIPVFSLGKRTVVQCNSCGHEFKKKERPLAIQNKLIELKGDYKVPVWHFAGAFLLAILVAGAFFQSGKKEKERQAFIAAPIQGDIYELKLDYKQYSSFKVLEVDNDSLTIVYNLYETNKMSGLRSINKEENFEGDVYRLDRSVLPEMLEDGSIVDIERD